MIDIDFEGHEDDKAAVLAAADLAVRAGAVGFAIDYSAGPPVTWHTQAFYKGARVFVRGLATPAEAATALAVRLLTGANCKCGQKVALRDGAPGCPWRLVGRRWEPGCDAPPFELSEDKRGDVAAMRGAVDRAKRKWGTT